MLVYEFLPVGYKRGWWREGVLSSVDSFRHVEPRPNTRDRPVVNKLMCHVTEGGISAKLPADVSRSWTRRNTLYVNQSGDRGGGRAAGVQNNTGSRSAWWIQRKEVLRTRVSGLCASTTSRATRETPATNHPIKRASLIPRSDGK